MPKLWNQTIASHRQEVQHAILETTAGLVAREGLRAVTMSRIAEETGIGRATLYKYFPDVETILAAWHEQQIGGHLEQLRQVASGAGDARQRLEAVLERYAQIQQQHHGLELSRPMHHPRAHQVEQAQEQLRSLVRGLLGEGARAGLFRDDVPAEELVSYCLHATAAAAGAGSRAGMRRLVAVTLSGLRRS